MRRFDRHPADHTVRLRGQIDIGTAHEIPAVLDAARRSGGGPLVVDLSGLEFIDCCGAARLEESAANGPFEFVGASDTVRRVLDLVSPGLLSSSPAESARLMLAS